MENHGVKMSFDKSVHQICIAFMTKIVPKRDYLDYLLVANDLQNVV